jgi:hypothetical protein
MSYEKRPTFACEECHKSFKNQRALDAHNAAKHPPDLIIIDEAAEIDPEAWDKLKP